jgi:hypothetical protein
MSEDQLQVVFGSGQVGRTLAARGSAATPLATAITDTITRYRTRGGTR